MKNKIFLIILPVIAIVGLVIFGYSKATAPMKNETQPHPQIEITPQSFDFGEIEFGTITKYTFKIKNSGNDVLEIKRVATSCACTSAKVGKERVNPGEETELFVEYDTKLMGEGAHGKGKQERIIYVKSNDPVNPQIEAIIFAFVK